MSRSERANRVYIAGPMTGLPEFNRPAFAAAAERWRTAGWEVVNPAESDPVGTELTHAEYMRKDIPLLLTVGAIAFLPGWRRSKGARFERHMGKILDLPMFSATRVRARQLELEDILA